MNMRKLISGEITRPSDLVDLGPIRKTCADADAWLKIKPKHVGRKIDSWCVLDYWRAEEKREPKGGAK